MNDYPQDLKSCTPTTATRGTFHLLPTPFPMIPVSCKRLVEADLPIAAVSVHSAREESTRHGHASTLHLWWARRPPAACRAASQALLGPASGKEGNQLHGALKELGIPELIKKSNP